LSYIVWAVDIARDLRAFSELGRFERVGWVHNEYVTNAVPEIATAAVAQSSGQGTRLVSIGAGPKAADVLAKLPEDLDGVYVGPNTQMSIAEMKALAKGLGDRGLPSFAWFGRSDVELGFLTGVATKEDVVRLGRRVALNAQSILLGEDTAHLVTSFRQQEQLVVNMATARAIGVWPNWSVLTDAILINHQRETVKRKLDLASAVKAAMQSNLDLAVMRQVVASGRQDIRKARANLLPQLGVSISGAMIDADRAGFGNAERTLQWGGQLSQMLYDERAYANLAIQRELQDSRVRETETLRLDIAYQVALAYLNLLQAQTVERIRRENLALTRDNLALARLRERLGSARPGEVLRWEAQIASSRSDLIAAASGRNQLEILVNSLLNRPLEEPFATREATIDDPELLSSESRLRAYLDNPFRFKALREFMVVEGIRLAPELKQLDSLSAAVARRKTSAKRSLYIPRVGLSASATHRFLTGGAGTDPITLPPGTPDIGIPSPDEFDWMVGVSATLPLFEGGRRYAEIAQADSEVARLVAQKRAASNQISQRVRTALHQAGASYAAIRLSQDAATAAKENLALVSDAYSRGSASIVVLLDAQNQALVADLAAANASYHFLADLMGVERAMGRFNFFATDADRNAFFERLDRFALKRAARLGVRVAPTKPKQAPTAAAVPNESSVPNEQRPAVAPSNAAPATPPAQAPAASPPPASAGEPK
jgi:outer membrane protein TolC